MGAPAATAERRTVYTPAVTLAMGTPVPENLAGQVPTGATYFEGLASTPDRDKRGEVIAPEFWNEKALEQYRQNPVLLYMHDVYDVAGKMLAVEARPEGLWCAGFVSGQWQKAWQVEQRLIKCLSVGFDFYMDAVQYDSHTDTIIFREGVLLEISLATIPINSAAQFQVVKAEAGGLPVPDTHFLTAFRSKSIMEKSFFDKAKEWVSSLVPTLAADATEDAVLAAMAGLPTVQAAATEGATEAATKAATDNITAGLPALIEAAVKKAVEPLQTALATETAAREKLEGDLATRTKAETDQSGAAGGNANDANPTAQSRTQANYNGQFAVVEGGAKYE